MICTCNNKHSHYYQHKTSIMLTSWWCTKKLQFPVCQIHLITYMITFFIYIECRIYSIIYKLLTLFSFTLSAGYIQSYTSYSLFSHLHWVQDILNHIQVTHSFLIYIECRIYSIIYKLLTLFSVDFAISIAVFPNCKTNTSAGILIILITHFH